METMTMDEWKRELNTIAKLDYIRDLQDLAAMAYKSAMKHSTRAVTRYELIVATHLQLRAEEIAVDAQMRLRALLLD